MDALAAIKALSMKVTELSQEVDKLKQGSE